MRNSKKKFLHCYLQTDSASDKADWERALSTGLGSWADRERQPALVAETTSNILGCVNRSIAKRLSEGIIDHYLMLVRPHLDI